MLYNFFFNFLTIFIFFFSHKFKLFFQFFQAFTLFVLKILASSFQNPSIIECKIYAIFSPCVIHVNTQKNSRGESIFHGVFTFSTSRNLKIAFFSHHENIFCQKFLTVLITVTSQFQILFFKNSKNI